MIIVQWANDSIIQQVKSLIGDDLGHNVSQANNFNLIYYDQSCPPYVR